MSASAADEAAQLFSQSHRLRSHPEDDRSRTPSEPDVDADADAGHEAESHDMPSLTSNYHLPRNTAFDANTGPKGVIADARSYEQAKKQKWLQQNQAPVSRESNGTPYYGQKEVSPVRRDGRSVSPQSQDGEEDDLDFMERWRKTRLSELRTSGDVRNRRQSPSMRRYGTMQTVDAVGYLDAIEKVGRETTVIVCIYDDRSEVSHLVEDCLSLLARKHNTTRFVKLHFEDAEMDVASVPAILAYRNGDLFANLVSVIDEIPAERTLSSSSLEWVLRKHHALT